MPRSRWAVAIAAVTLVVLTVPLGAQSASADSLTVTVSTIGPLTLPADDGFNDNGDVSISTDQDSRVKVAITTADGIDPETVVLDEPFTSHVSQTATIPLTRPSGDYLLTVYTYADDEMHFYPFTIGSGVATTATLASPTQTLYPYADGYLDSIATSVVVKDETGTQLPFTGTVTATAGTSTKSTPVTGLLGAAGAASLSLAGLPTGTATVVASVTGPAGGAHATNSLRVALLATAVKSYPLSLSTATIYPAKDGYRDTLVVKLAPTTTTGHAVPITGTAVISRSGKTIASWKLTQSTTSISWNGRSGKKIIAGAYLLTATVTGPQGAAVMNSAIVTVSAKKLVTKKKTVHLKPSRVFGKLAIGFDPDGLGYCEGKAKGVLYCKSYTATGLGGLSLINSAYVSVPHAVSSSARFASPTVKFTAGISTLKGSGEWASVDLSTFDVRTGHLKKGTHAWGSALSIHADKQVSIAFYLKNKSALTLTKFTAVYSYKVLA